MSVYYKKYTPYQGMNNDDYEALKSAKLGYKNAQTDDERLKYSTVGNDIRSKYNITDDNYSYDDLKRFDDVNAIGQNPYDADASATLNNLKQYKTYTDKHEKQLIEDADAIRNFAYDPNSDQNFKAYADMYARQGRAAQDGTYSDLTALSGGRNNSWASAATAQVGQAYAQKAADMIPQLAEAAYNRLLQQYNIDSGMSERDYGRMMDKYNMDSNMYSFQNQRAEMFRNAILNQNNFDMSAQQWQHDFDVAQKYDGRQQDAQTRVLEANAGQAEYDLSLLPEKTRLELRSMELSNEQTEYVIKQYQKALEYFDRDKAWEYAMNEAQRNNIIATTNKTNFKSGGGGSGGSGGEQGEQDASDLRLDYTDDFINKINSYAEQYNQQAITVSNGKYYVNHAYDDKICYEILNDDTLSADEMQFLLDTFGISQKTVEGIIRHEMR